MGNALYDSIDDHISKLSLLPASRQGKWKRSGMTFRPGSEVAEGALWIEPIRDMCAVLMVDLTFHRDMTIGCQHPPSALVLSGQDMSGQHLSLPLPTVKYLRSYASRGTILRDSRLQGVAVVMLPEYYESFLPQVYPVDAAAIVSLAAGRDGMRRLPQIDQVFDQMAHMDPSPTAAPLYYESKILELIALLQMDREDPAGTGTAEDWDGQDACMMAQIDAYLQEHCQEHITLEMLAKRFYTNKNTVARLLRERHGTNITGYLQSLRMEKARVLLETTDQSMEDIAHAVGYKTGSTFSVCFKEQTGMTPTSYRKRFRSPA